VQLAKYLATASGILIFLLNRSHQKIIKNRLLLKLKCVLALEITFIK